jgi:hypothetical protein
MSKDLHTSFVVVAHIFEGLCLSAVFTAEGAKLYLPLTRMNSDSVHRGMTICFALGNISVKRNRDVVAWNEVL